MDTLKSIVGTVFVVIAFVLFCTWLLILAWNEGPGSQLLAVMVGAGSTAGFSYILASQRWQQEKQSEKRKFIIAKLEETHEASRSLARATSQSYAKVSIIMVAPNANDTIRQMKDNYEQSGEPPNLRYLIMLVDFYFPELRPQLKGIRDAYDEYGKLLGDDAVRAFAKEMPARRQAWEQLKTKHERILEASRDFQDALSEVAQRL